MGASARGQAEIAVIGAGAVGLACAALLARRGHAVFILERHPRIGQEASSRSSEVIHAGLYYPPGSLKARSCVEGRRLLLDWAEAHGVAHRQVGKLVVASDPAQAPALTQLMQRGQTNGAGGLRLLEADEIAKLEPQLRVSLALWSPDSGIFDTHGYLESLRRVAFERAAVLALNTRVIAIEQARRVRVVTADARGEQTALEVDWVVNAAGLDSDKLAALTGVDVGARALALHPCKGDYFALSSRLAGCVRHLIYPLPEAAGLGIHLTLDLAGQLRAGPDASYVAAPSYTVDPEKRGAFAAAIQRYLPAVRPDDLTPAYAGVRPKLQGPGEGFRDFVCEVFPEAPRVIQLVGIESPGLTASLALAQRVAQLVLAQ